MLYIQSDKLCGVGADDREHGVRLLVVAVEEGTQLAYDNEGRLSAWQNMPSTPVLWARRLGAREIR